MPVMDDIRAEAKKAKEKGLKYALSYFWEYYKFIALGIIIGIIMIVSLVRTIINNKPIAFEAIMIDSYFAPSDEALAEYLEINTDKYTVFQDSSYRFTTENGSYTQSAYTASQKLAATVASKEVDVIICDPEIFSRYKNYVLADLSDFFDEAFLKELGDKVIYDNILDSDSNTLSGPFPLAIDITDCPQLLENGCYKEGTVVYFCIVPNTENPEYCVKYYDFLNSTYGLNMPQ